MTITVNIKDDYKNEFLKILESLKSRVVEDFIIEDYSTPNYEIKNSLKNAVSEVNSNSIYNKEKTLEDLIDEL